MEKYISPKMEVVTFEAEDVVTASNCRPFTLPIHDKEVDCTQDKVWCTFEGTQW